MSSETNPNCQEPTEAERFTLATALSGMSIEHLVEVRATARRLGHLPFHRLVNALFEQESGEAPSGRQEPVDDTRLREEATVTYGTRRPKPSKFVDELLAQIERILAAKAAD